jgi:hypothetical protein
VTLQGKAKGNRARFQAPERCQDGSSESDRQPPRLPPARASSECPGRTETGTSASECRTRVDKRYGPGRWKLGEPHDRFQGATNLKSARWRKPPQPGGTARAERVRSLATPGQRQRRAGWKVPSGVSRTAALRSSDGAGSGHQAPMPMEGRTLTTPREESTSPAPIRRKAARLEAGRNAGRQDSAERTVSL